MKKAVIYTSLTGGYDNLPQYDILDSFFDYICFTNDYPDGEKVGQWEVRSIPIEINDKTRLSRYVKLMPHKVFPDYEYSIWFDANLEITDKKIYEIIKTHISAQKKWCGIKHPTLDCIYQDAKECLKLAKVTYREIVSQVKFCEMKSFRSTLVCLRITLLFAIIMIIPLETSTNNGGIFICDSVEETK